MAPEELDRMISTLTNNSPKYCGPEGAQVIASGEFVDKVLGLSPEDEVPGQQVQTVQIEPEQIDNSDLDPLSTMLNAAFIEKVKNKHPAEESFASHSGMAF